MVVPQQDPMLLRARQRELPGSSRVQEEQSSGVPGQLEIPTIKWSLG